MHNPTIGRTVWFKGMNNHIHAAIICHVHSAHEVNLTVFDADGTTFARHNVALVQGRTAEPFECEWPTQDREAEVKPKPRAALLAPKKAAQ
jgi:hypothetical protein